MNCFCSILIYIYIVTTKQLNVNNRTYYFYNDLINIEGFDPKLLKLDKNSSKDITIYYIGYVTKKPEYSINSVNPLYLLIDEIDGFAREKEGNKYLNISLTDSNNDVLKRYAEVWSGIKDQIEKINNGQLKESGKDYMKIEFNSDDDLPLNIILKFCILTIIIRTIIEKDGKYYPQFFLDDCLYEA